MTLKISVDDKDFIKKVNELVAKVKQPEKMLRTIVLPLMYQDVMAHFKNEQGPTGPWQRLSAKTLKRRGDNARILQDTGVLRGSFQRGVEGTTGNLAFIGSAVGYSPTHQFGRGNIPARPFLWLSDDAKQRIIDGLKNYIQGNYQ